MQYLKRAIWEEVFIFIITNDIITLNLYNNLDADTLGAVVG